MPARFLIFIFVLVSLLTLSGCMKIDINQHYGIDNKLWKEMTPQQQGQVRHAWEHSRRELQTWRPDAS